MSGWQKTKIGEFLFERKGLIDPNEKDLFLLRKIDKIDFAEGKIFLTQYLPTKTKQIIVKQDDLVFSGLNIEKGAIAINDFNQDLVVSANYSTCEINYSKINRDFLKIFIKSPSFKKLLTDNLKKDYGFTRPKHLLNLEINLPPLEQQKQIAKKLKLAEEKQKILAQEINKQKTYLKNLRKQILQDAIAGNLTKDWREANPTTESANELLKKISQEKQKLIAEKKIKKEKPLPAINENEILFISKNILWIRIDDLFIVEKGITGIKNAIPGKYPLVVTADERLTHNDFQFDSEAIIIPMVSSSGHGHASLKRIHYQVDKFALGSILSALIPIDKNLILSKFYYYFLFQYKEELIVSKMSGAANVSLNVSDLRSIVVPVLPFVAQKKLTNILTKIDQAEKQIEKSLEYCKQLSACLLAEAFCKS